MLREPVHVIDLEATGLSPDDGDRLLEVALLRIEGGRITDRFQSLVDCGRRVPSHITAYTGITQAMVDAAPPVAHVLAQLLRRLGDAPVIAHGAGFDERMLRTECGRAGLPLVAEPFRCTLALARQLYPSLANPSLGVLLHKLRIPHDGRAHRAAADAEAVAALLQHLAGDAAARRGRRGVTVAELFDFAPRALPARPAFDTSDERAAVRYG